MTLLSPRRLPQVPVNVPRRLCDLLHRRLQQLRCLRRCFDCYRVERTSSRAGLTPAMDHHLSRRTRVRDLPSKWPTTDRVFANFRKPTFCLELNVALIPRSKTHVSQSEARAYNQLVG
jgi:hypothetical protein